MPTGKINLEQFLFRQEGLQAEFSVKPPEDEADKAFRLRKEWWSFLVKEVGPYVLAALFVLAMAAYCFGVLLSTHSTEADRSRAWPALLAILGGVVGVVFGKATAK